MILDGRFSYFVQKFKGCTAYGTKQSFVSVRREKPLTADSTLSLKLFNLFQWSHCYPILRYGSVAILEVSCYTDGHRKPLKNFFNFFENRVRNGAARASI